jgi:Carboxypeptidase regulatory-like domain
MKRFAVLTFGCSLLLGSLSPAFSAELAGVVTNLQGQAVSGMQVVVQNPSKQAFGQAMTDASGHYQITGLSPKTYNYVLNPMSTGYRGGSAASYLGPKGLTINWKVSDSKGALALAGPANGLSALEIGSIVALGAGVVAGGVVGGYGAAGGFSSHSNNTPSSSSM